MGIKKLFRAAGATLAAFSFCAAQTPDFGFFPPSETAAIQVPEPSPEVIEDDSKSGEEQGGGSFVFAGESFPGFYKAEGQNKEPYNMPEILADVPKLWKEQGQLFKKVGADRGMDPYALAAYCVFESYNEKTHKFNTRHLDGVASGIASTQASDVKGGKVPGLEVRIPKTLSQAKEVLRNNPEYGVRFLAEEFKAWYYGGDYFKKYYGPALYKKIFGSSDFQGYRDLAKTFPRVAVPGWRDPDEERNNYGTQAQYVSRAYALYKAFQKADGK